MALLHFRSIERRRTARAAVCMQVLVEGEKTSGEKFKFWARTQSISQHGGLMQVEELLEVGQLLQLTNEYSAKTAQARVVSVRQERSGQRHAAFEFVQGGERFWNMVFPPAGAKPLRKLGARAGAGG